MKNASVRWRQVIAIDGGRACFEQAQQLRGVERAVAEAKKALIHEHVDHCLDALIWRGGVQ